MKKKLFKRVFIENTAPPKASKTPAPRALAAKSLLKAPTEPMSVKAPPADTPLQPPTPQILVKGPEVGTKNIGPDGLLPRPSTGDAAKPPEKVAPAKGSAEKEPEKKTVEVASLPPVPRPPEPEPPAEERVKPPERQTLNPRISAAMPRSFVPPPSSGEARKSSPDSSAGAKGEEAFNIKMDDYAKYYKHISKQVGSTLDILYGGDIALISPKPAEQKVIVDFKILRTGEITDVKLVYDGGDYMLSSIIQSSVRGTPLDPFPRYIKEGLLKIRYTFYFR